MRSRAARGDENVTLPLALVDKLLPARVAKQKCQAAQSRCADRRNDDRTAADKSSLWEVVSGHTVLRTLQNRRPPIFPAEQVRSWNQQRRDSNGNRERQEKPNAGSSQNQFPTLQREYIGPYLGLFLDGKGRSLTKSN